MICNELESGVFMEDRTLKVKKVDGKYKIRMYEGDQLLSRGWIRSPKQWEKDFPELSKNIIYSWDDFDKDSKVFQLYSEDGRNEYLEIEDFGANADDKFYQFLSDVVTKEKTTPKKVKDTKKANPKLIALTAGIAVLGISTIVSIVSWVGKLKEKEEVVTLENPTFTYEIEDSSLLLPNIDENQSLAKADSFFSQKEENEQVLIELYDQPNLPIELNLYMHQVAEQYGIPYLALIVAAHVESVGNFNNSSVEVVNSNGTRDVGFMQINSVNFAYLEEKLGISEYDIIHDDKVNIRCAAEIFDGFKNSNKNRNGGKINLIEFFRQYNGGSNYDQPSTEQYAARCLDAIAQFYNDGHVILSTPEGEIVARGKTLEQYHEEEGAKVEEASTGKGK